ncbi:MAG TPA: hypothetical protein VI933_01180 [archaeon]|nr:hypothetical protein [archaeon]
MPKSQIGNVTHFFPKVSVAIVKLSAPLAVGARVSIERGGSAFEQTIDNMQIEHKQIEKAEAGSEIAIKTVQATKAGAVVYEI